MKTLPAWLAAGLLLAPGAAPRAADETLQSRAEAGDAEAQFELGRKLLTGSGASKDPAAGVLWLTRAAEQGEARAQINLAMAYEAGNGVEPDEESAVNWLMRAADQGHPRAMALLGRRFWEGRGVARSPVLGFMWVRRAANLGSPLGQVRAGEFQRQLSPEEIEAAERLGRIQLRRFRRAAMRAGR